MRLALLPAAVAGALGLYQLGDPSIWIDEMVTVENASGDWWALRDELHWLYYATVKPWFALVGTSEIAIRLPSVLGAVVAVVLLFGLARKLFDERIAFASSLLFAVHPLVVQWSQQARGYTILLALVIGATWLLVRALERDDVAAWAEYGMAIALIAYWQVFSALVFAPVHAVLAWRRRRAVITWVLTGAALLPWLQVVRNRPWHELPTAWIPDLTLGYAARIVLELSGAMGIGLALAVVGIVFAREHRRLLVSWAFLPCVLAALASIHDDVFLSRYLIVCVPAFAILGGVAIVRVATHARVVAVTAAAAGTALGLFLWYSPDGSANWANEDWKAATEFVMRNGGAEVDPPGHTPAYLFYGGRVAETGWVVQRRPWGGFPPRDDVHRYFGEKLRVLRVRQGDQFPRRLMRGRRGDRSRQKIDNLAH